MKLRDLWLVANFVGFIYSMASLVSHSGNTDTILISSQSLVIGTYVAVSTYKMVAWIMTAGCVLGAFYFGFLAGGKENEKPQPLLLLPAILLAVMGINAIFYPIGARTLFQVFGLAYIAFGLMMLNIGGIYWLIHDLEESPRIRRKLRISFFTSISKIFPFC